MIKLLILILLFISPSWSFWCYNCQACNPDDNSAYKYCSGPYCELSFREGQRHKARQRCAEYAFKLGCTESWEGGKKMTTCYCNEKGCNSYIIIMEIRKNIYLPLVFLCLRKCT